MQQMYDYQADENKNIVFNPLIKDLKSKQMFIVKLYMAYDWQWLLNTL